MLCEQCNVREADVHLTEIANASIGQRRLCSICASADVRAVETEMAEEAHARLPDGETLDVILTRAAAHGTPDQRRQLALMLRVRAAQQPGRLTPTALAFLTRFGPPDVG
jgi:protein-arginine kinase activator protein McsA